MSGGDKPELIFTFQGSHHAIASEQSLIEAGVQVRVMPLPAQIGVGCGICLRIWPENYRQAADVLVAAGICPQGVWRKQSDDGGTRYVPYKD